MNCLEHSICISLTPTPTPLLLRNTWMFPKEVILFIVMYLAYNLILCWLYIELKKACTVQSRFSDIKFSDNLWFSDYIFYKDHFSFHYIKAFHLVTLCELVTVFVETKSVTKSRLHCFQRRSQKLRKIFLFVLMLCYQVKRKWGSFSNLEFSQYLKFNSNWTLARKIQSIFFT